MINRFRQFRRLATRYEKRAENYRAMWIIAAIPFVSVVWKLALMWDASGGLESRDLLRLGQVFALRVWPCAENGRRLPPACRMIDIHDMYGCTLLSRTRGPDPSQYLRY